MHSQVFHTYTLDAKVFLNTSIPIKIILGVASKLTIGLSELVWWKHNNVLPVLHHYVPAHWNNTHI